MSAQTAATTPAPPPKSTAGDVVQLSPFTVSTDTDEGYYSRHTLSGNRMNAPITDIPQPIAVFNEQFLLDTGLADSERLADYFIGAQVDGARGNEGRMVIRGFDGAETQPMINGFMMIRRARDTYNVDRVELVKGPSSVTYGNAQPGGQSNTTTKQAVFGKTFAKVAQQFGSWDLSRTTLDANTSRGRVAVRLNALYHHNGSWKDWETNTKEAYSLTAAFNVTRATVLRLEGEYVEGSGVSADNYLGFRNPDIWARVFINEELMPRSKSGGWNGPDAVWTT